MPQGLAWERFFAMGDAVAYGQDAPEIAATGAVEEGASGLSVNNPTALK